MDGKAHTEGGKTKRDRVIPERVAEPPPVLPEVKKNGKKNGKKTSKKKTSKKKGKKK